MAEDDLQEVPEEPTRPGLVRRIAEAFAQRSGAVVLDETEHELMEAEVADRRQLRREMDLIAWQAMDGDVDQGNQDLGVEARRQLVKQARSAWAQDPQLGAAVDLMNDFTLGRGIPKPIAKDPEVQKRIDDAWDDEDNRRILTDYASQLALGTDLSLQSNVFILRFTGQDGKVKLSMLPHDDVEGVVRSQGDRRKILYYKVRQRRWKYDWATDSYIADTDFTATKPEFLYFAHWRNEPDTSEGDSKPPSQKLGEGEVYHVAINRTSEMAFGHPTMHRTLRWATAFNSLMESQVDAAKAAAAFMMKRKVKGTPNQVRKIATQALSRSGELGRAYLDPETAGPNAPKIGPSGGSILNENEAIEHESFKLDSGAQNANTSGQMIRSQISAATHFPQHYLGDIGSANLATATSMELPVLKAVESRQEVIEQLCRWFVDQVIEQALENGGLKEELTAEEWLERQEDADAEGKDPNAQPDPTTANAAVDLGAQPAAEPGEPEIPEDVPEEERKRDLGYDFGLPSPLRRMMSDLVNSVATIARTFDPNGTNIELTRVLFSICMGEGLEVNDPAEVTDKIFPPGYKDPAMAALQQAQPPGAPGEPPDFGNVAPPGITMVPTGANGNGNGASPPGASLPEDEPYGPTEARLVAEGAVVLDEPATPPQRPPRTREEALQDLEEATEDRLPDEAREAMRRRLRMSDAEFDEAFGPMLDAIAGKR